MTMAQLIALVDAEAGPQQKQEEGTAADAFMFASGKYGE
jgi:hypothetical protein